MKANALVYKQPHYGGGTPPAPIPIVDSQGQPLHAGDYVATITDTTWLKKGDVVVVTGASGDNAVAYETFDHSQSAVKTAKIVRMDTTPELTRQFTLARLHHDVAYQEELIAKAKLKIAGLQAQIAKLEPTPEPVSRKVI